MEGGLSYEKIWNIKKYYVCKILTQEHTCFSGKGFSNNL